MKTIQFNSSNVGQFKAQLDEMKVKLLFLCRREDDKGPPDVSVIRYNFAREELKEEFPLEVICMLDGSAYIHEILSAKEKKWMKLRKKGGKS